MSRLRVVRALLEDAASPHYGLELIRNSGVGGGGLYPILAKLEADGWIVGEWEVVDEAAAGRRKRRYYRLTGLGEREARAVLIDAATALALPAPGAVRRPGLAPS